uniref:L19 ribosomal protein n=1 Tax=Solanum tuberosum TaxID=4113 RepID=M1BCQ5_SOLTU
MCCVMVNLLETRLNVSVHSENNRHASLTSPYKGYRSCLSQYNAMVPSFPRRFITTGATSVDMVSEDASALATPRIKFKRLDKTAKHIMQILDKEAVEEVRAQSEIPDIKPGYIIQLKLEVPENKRRVSTIKGIVIARRNAGLNTTFRLRRLVAGVGVENLFHLACAHPEAHHAFIKLNNAFKDLDKRRVLDEKIKRKEEQEEMKAELQAFQWRRLQVALKSDEWMTTLPPERKSGVVRMHSTRERSFGSFNTYKERQEKSRSSVDAELVVHCNKTRRSKSMVEKHQEIAARSKSMKKSKHESVKEEWKGNHPWKPWDREKDLIAGRKNVKLDASDMSQSLTSRFSS